MNILEWVSWLQSNNVDLRGAALNSVSAAGLAGLQAQLSRAGVSFNHLSPNVERDVQARLNYGREMGYGPGPTWWTNDALGSFAHFMICAMCGESTYHSPVMFLDGEPQEFQREHQQRALIDAFCIPAPNGHRTPVIYLVER